jgi:alpha-ketoglutarate-dependent taurine dioxygenase
VQTKAALSRDRARSAEVDGAHFAVVGMAVGLTDRTALLIELTHHPVIPTLISSLAAQWRKLSLRRLQAIGVASLVLLAHFFGSAHLALVPHAVCPEHGELIHVRESTELPLSRTDDNPDPRVVSEEGPPSFSALRDNHCLVASQRRERTTLASAALSTPELQLQTPERPAVELSARAAPEALFRLAPKNSPPA